MRTLTRATAVVAPVLLATALAGCGDGPTAEEVQREHQEAATTAQREIESRLAPLGQTGEALASATRDSCETGQHNWKVDDPYDVRCTVEVHQAYRVTGPDFRAAADSVTDTFLACTNSEAEETLRDYWDALQGTETKNFEGPYRPDFMPSYRLDCGPDGDQDVRITVTSWATLPPDEQTMTENEHAMGRPCVNSTETDPCEWDGIPARNIWQFDNTDEGWVVFVSGSRVYATTS